MLSSQWMKFGLAAIAAVAVTGFVFAGDKNEDKEQVVQLKDCPAVVQQTIKDTVGDAAIKEIEKATEDGKVQYDVTIVENGKDKEFSVAENGKFLSWEEDEKDGNQGTEKD